jgi:hypothetical protein
MQIKEEDRWKAAFKTPFGAYETNVMLFRLTNSPSTFCRAMERMFLLLVRKYPTELFVYVCYGRLTVVSDVDELGSVLKSRKQWWSKCHPI